MQEGFLLAWCAAIVLVCNTPRRLRIILRVWCLSALAWALFLVVCSLTGKIRFPGGTSGYGDRARLWFDHPNLAGNYFVLAVFIVVAARIPRHPLLRILAVVTLVAAIMLTGSNTALLCLPVGGLVIVFLRVRERRGSAPALGVCACLVMAGGALWMTVGQSTLEGLQQNDNPLLRYSVARTSRSAEGRESLFASSFELYRTNNVVGVGPAATRHTLERTAGAREAKEAHNDYLGTLVERGPLGIVALLALAGTIAVRAVGVQHLPPAWAAVVPEPAALAGAAAGFAVTALTHEVLHYRHFWTLLAVLGVLFLVRDQHRRQPDHSLTPWEHAPAQAHGR
jgi:O-antigen ligase